MGERFYESMTRVALPDGRVVRVWGRESMEVVGPRGDVQIALKPFKHPGGFVISDIANALEALPGIAAYEILDAGGNGVVAYLEWP